MGAPLADGPEAGGPGGLPEVGLVVVEVAEGVVDGVGAGGAADGDHADAVGGRHVAGVAEVLVEFVAEGMPMLAEKSLKRRIRASGRGERLAMASTRLALAATNGATVAP